MWSPSSFQHFVNDQLNRCSWLDKCLDEEHQQQTTELKRRPTSATENVMEAIKMSFLLQSHRSESRCDGSASMGEKGSFDQQHRLSPSWLTKSRLEWSKQ
ncbi:hypothetical protein KSD_78570 [Ktedonobacter sp. SOSP1-85]|nr:hypothetical protein KSD_78570 [Ktedonobacter sp. SOSP1-85]